jgi:hypothetical protein
MDYLRALSRWTLQGMFRFFHLSSESIAVHICLICVYQLVLVRISRMAIAFYCLSTLDVTGVAERQISATDRKSWKEWIWDQYVGEEYPVSFSALLLLKLHVCDVFFLCPLALVCAIIEGGFHPGPFVSISGGDTAHVRPFPRSSFFARLCALRFQDHHNDHIY